MMHSDDTDKTFGKTKKKSPICISNVIPQLFSAGGDCRQIGPPESRDTCRHNMVSHRDAFADEKMIVPRRESSAYMRKYMT